MIKRIVDLGYVNKRIVGLGYVNKMNDVVKSSDQVKCVSNIFQKSI